ncbi:MAG: tetratricopeptide repeat protein [Planctomycetes bacterium]|nr:tetratricopeptide repeat protein [Planctomycetota bacterium]
MGQAGDKRYVILIYAALALATFIGFCQVRNNEFISYDDNTYITENPYVSGGISGESIVWAFTASHGSNWHPVTWISHMVDCQLFGLNAGAHHIVNLLIHIANTLLLFWVFKKMTGAIWCSGFVAAAFALHPLHVESVAWAAERKDVLSAFFWIVTIAAYNRYVKQPNVRKYLLVILFFALGLMSKPMLVTLPFVLLLLDYWPLGRFKNIKVLIIEKIPLFILAGISSVITFVVQQRTGAVSDISNVGFNFRVSNALVSYISYIAKMFWPVRLAILYPHQVDRLDIWQPMVCFILLVSVTIGVIYLKRRYLTVGWLWYLGTLVPVIGLVQVGSQAMADRYTYLPLVGLFIMAAWGISEVLSKWRYRKIALAVSAVLIITAMLICTHKQVRIWANNFTLFGHTLAVTEDNYVIYYNLGHVYQSRGQIDKAIRQYRETIRIMPKHVKAYNNLGVSLRLQGKLDESISCYRQALMLNPYHTSAYYNLGHSLQLQGKLEEAKLNFRRAIELNPRHTKAYNNLGIILRSQGRVNEAIAYFRDAIAVEPGFVLARQNLGLALATTGQIDEAIEQFQETLRLVPNWWEPFNALAWLWATQPGVGSANHAVVAAERAAELTNYQNAIVLDTLAAAYAAAGQFEQAIRSGQAAIDLALTIRNEKLVHEIGNRLELYKQGKPYLESAN